MTLENGKKYKFTRGENVLIGTAYYLNTGTSWVRVNIYDNESVTIYAVTWDYEEVLPSTQEILKDAPIGQRFTLAFDPEDWSNKIYWIKLAQDAYVLVNLKSSSSVQVYISGVLKAENFHDTKIRLITE